MKAQDDSGQSLLELALLVPVLVILVYGTLFIVELSRERLYVHQSARYMAFAAAKMPISSYGAPAASGGALGVAGQVIKETALTYSDITLPNIPGVDPTITGILGGIATGVVRPRMRDLPVTIKTQPLIPLLGLGPEPILPTNSIEDAINASGGMSPTVSLIYDIVKPFVDIGFGLLLESEFHFNFSTAFATGTASEAVAAQMLPVQSMLPADKSRIGVQMTIAALRSFTRQESVSVIADPWALGDGRDVRLGGFVGNATNVPVIGPSGGTGSATQTESGLHFQTNKLTFLFSTPDKAVNGNGGPNGGISANFTAFLQALTKTANAIGTITGGQPNGGILDTRVVSLNYGGPSGITSGQVTQKVGNFSALGRPTYETSDIDASAFSHRGNHFMGCPDAEQSTCKY